MVCRTHTHSHYFTSVYRWSSAIRQPIKSIVGSTFSFKLIVVLNKFHHQSNHLVWDRFTDSIWLIITINHNFQQIKFHQVSSFESIFSSVIAFSIIKWFIVYSSSSSSWTFTSDRTRVWWEQSCITHTHVQLHFKVSKIVSLPVLSKSELLLFFSISSNDVHCRSHVDWE